MYKKGFRKSVNIGGAFATLEYRRKFALEHPHYFNPCGTLIFSGPQGSGKTLSAVDYVTRCLHEYPLAILVTNTEFKEYPFNAELAGDDEKYVTKYMSKSLYDTCLDVGSHLYYRSRGLSGAQLVRQGTLIDDTGIPIDYESDFCRVSWVPYSDELLDRLSKTIL